MFTKGKSTIFQSCCIKKIEATKMRSKKVTIFSLLLLLSFFLTLANTEQDEGEDGVCEKNDENCDSQKKVEQKKSSKELYAELRENLKSIKESCGEVCDTSKTGVPGKYYDFIEKKVDCNALFSNPLIDEPSSFSYPPRKIPKYLKEDFSYNGKIDIQEFYRDDSQGTTHWLHWTKEMMEGHFYMFDKDILKGSYGIAVVHDIYWHLTEKMPVKDQHVLVIGSQRPWLETIILRAGARHITTLDYVPITSDWPTITTMTPDTFGQMFLNGSLPEFDSIVSFSSVEHSGLGRYGDALNPWGDLIAMARAWCVLKPGAKALIGVPSGPDRIEFNGHKMYGPILYSHLFANWKQIFTLNDFDKFSEKCNYCYQPNHVIERV